MKKSSYIPGETLDEDLINKQILIYGKLTKYLKEILFLGGMLVLVLAANLIKDNSLQS